MITRVRDSGTKNSDFHSKQLSVLCEQRRGNTEISRIVHTVFARN